MKYVRKPRRRVTAFLIEFRLHGYARRYAYWARERVLREARRLGVKRLPMRFVPHICLFGGAETSSLRNVISELEMIGRKYTLVPFKLGVKRGEFQRPDANWLYLDVQPSPSLEEFQSELARSLIRLEKRIADTCPPYDHDDKFIFHCSIGKFDPAPRYKHPFKELCDFAETKCTLEAFRLHNASVFGRLFKIIKKYLFRLEEEDHPGINQYLLRVTVLGRRSRIQGEYDLVLKRLLNRREALSKVLWQQTINKFRGLQGLPQRR
jgi:2'-5' RNA ligase